MCSTLATGRCGVNPAESSVASGLGLSSSNLRSQGGFSRRAASKAGSGAGASKADQRARAGQPISHGRVDDSPFAWRAVASTPAQPPYDGYGKTATLYAYVPHQGSPPEDWEGDQITTDLIELTHSTLQSSFFAPLSFKPNSLRQEQECASLKEMPLVRESDIEGERKPADPDPAPGQLGVLPAQRVRPGDDPILYPARHDPPEHAIGAEQQDQDDEAEKRAARHGRGL